VASVGIGDEEGTVNTHNKTNLPAKLVGGQKGETFTTFSAS
jgi:hypothetical protein